MRFPWRSLPEPWNRLPLLSVGLAAVWLVSALVVQVGFAGVARDAENRLLTAARFGLQHPEVQIAPRVLPVAQALMPGFEDNEMFDFLRRKRGEPSESQDRADELATHALGTLDAHPARALGLVGARPRPHAFLSHAFVHAGVVHALVTLLLWLISAPLLESLWGRRVLAGTTAGWLVLTAAAQLALDAGVDRAHVGGTACISASVAAVVARFRMREVDLLAWLSPVANAELSIPAVLLAPVWALGLAAVAWTLPGTWTALDPPVAWAAIAAGVALGAGTALGIERLGWEERFGTRAESLVRAATTRAADLRTLRARRAAGDVDGACAELGPLVQRNPGHRDAVLLWFAWAVEDEDPDRAAPAMVALMGHELRRGAEDVALAHWSELATHVDDVPVDPPTWLRLADAAKQRGDDETLIALAQELLAAEAGPAERARIARRIETVDGSLALSTARTLLVDDALPETERAELEALVARLDPSADEGDPVGDEVKRETKAAPPPNVFYEETDRTAFGDTDDLSSVADFPRGVLCEARPVVISGLVLRAQAEDGEVVEVAWERLRAVSMVGVRDLGPKPVVLVDLLLDGGGMERPLSLLRFRSDRFDPRALLPEAPEQPLAALCAVVEAMLANGGARPLPDAEAAAGRPVRVFDTVEAYTAEVLRPAAEDLA